MTTATATATATTTTTTSTTLTVTKKLERHPDLSLEQSNSIVKWCRDAIDQNKDFLYDTLIFEQAIQQACQHYDLQPQSLTSLLRNTHVWHVKITTRHVKLKLQNHVERYVQGESILEIARDNRYPPYLLARAMLEVLLLNTNKNSSGRKGLTEAMRDPIGKLGHVSCICEEYRSSENNTEEQPLTRLAREVMHVIAVDPMYGPEHDEVRHNIGVEYEELLEQVLTSMDIPFETEDQLRERGASKTPDVLLSTPVAVRVKPMHSGNTSTADDDDDDDDGWRVVCWIDSKALFGDAHTHKDSVLPQAESYIHRFGPGLVLYWFGHAPLLDDANGDLVVCGWNLPDQLLLPTGEVARQPIYPATTATTQYE